MKKDYSAEIYRVNCLAADLETIYHQAALKLGLSDSTMFVLYLLYEKGGSCMLYDIRKETNISKQTIHSAVRKLEKEGILYLQQQDGRAKMVHLTEKGKGYAKQTVGRLFQAECGTFEGWTEMEISLYMNLSEKYNEHLRKQIEKM